MGEEDLRILLEDGGDRDHRHIVGDRIERHQRVRGHEEVELAGDQQHAVVVVGAARHDGDVEPVFPVGAVGRGLEKSAVLGFGHPVGSERDLVQRLGLGARRDRRTRASRTAVNARGKKAGFMVGLRRSFWPMMGGMDVRIDARERLPNSLIDFLQTTLQIGLKKRLAR